MHARHWPRVVVVVLALAVLATIVRLAWLSDDCYVTLRSVENVIAGHGPVWNVGERVQTYTHPAWFWLLVLARWLSGEHYFTTIVLSVVVSTSAVAVLVAVARTPFVAAVVLVALLGSRTFGDFATSGLETPLVMLLLASLVLVDANTPPGGTRLGAVAALVVACGLTRLDLVVIAGPVLLAHVRRERLGRQFATVALAAAPLLGWHAFAAFYYGSPFPITAYAKAIATDLPIVDLLRQGWAYVVITASHDPSTAVVIALGAIVGLADARLRARACAVGIVMSSLYVVRVGGDFMVGRFFLPAFVVALAVLARALAVRGNGTKTIALLACLGVPWLAGTPSMLRPPSSDVVPTDADRGVVDERRFYYRTLGLWSPHRAVPTPGALTSALRRQGRERRIVTTSAQAGLYPFVAGELFHFVDPWLCDPLLMRLPTVDTNGWRIGHFTRAVPDGYPTALAFGDGIPHPGLRDYHAALRTVLHSDLGSAERWETLVAWWTGRFDAGRSTFVAEEYRSPPRREVSLQSLSRRCADGTLWCDDPDVRLLGRGGLRIRAEGPITATALQADLLPLTAYTFVFRRGDAEVGRTNLAAAVEILAAPDDAGDDVLGWVRHMLGTRRFEVPIPAALPAFDAIDVDAVFYPWTIAGIGGITRAP